MVTSLGSVESGACASSRVPQKPLLDTLADEKPLTTQTMNVLSNKLVTIKKEKFLKCVFFLDFFN